LRFKLERRNRAKFPSRIYHRKIIAFACIYAHAERRPTTTRSFFALRIRARNRRQRSGAQRETGRRKPVGQLFAFSIAAAETITVVAFPGTKRPPANGTSYGNYYQNNKTTATAARYQCLNITRAVPRTSIPRRRTKRFGFLESANTSR